MITKEEKTIIIKHAEEYGISSVFLFGSSLESKEAKDYNIGIEGIEPKLFFDFYGKLIKELSKPVDLIDLSKDIKFTRLIKESGEKIYG